MIQFNYLYIPLLNKGLIKREILYYVWFDASMVYELRSKRLPWNGVSEGVDPHRGWFQTINYHLKY
ncbi:MAG: hypothetical protein ACKESC_00460 [Candidatus Hodgkinia cicadicola]